MKTPIVVLTIAMASTMTSAATAQHLNWRSLEGDHRHLVTASFGANSGSYYGLSYGYHLRWGPIPLALGAGARVPFGREVLDDWQVGVGARGEAWRSGDLSLGVGFSWLVRRYESVAARLYNAATELDVSFGVSRQRWSAAAIATYEGSSLTHIEHKLLKEYYPPIRDGWYDAGAGSFRFGGATGYSGRSWGAALTTGRIFGKNFSNDPTLPYFAELSLRKGF